MHSWARKGTVVLAVVMAGSLACEPAAEARGGGSGGGGRGSSGAGKSGGHRAGMHSGQRHHHANARTFGAGAALAPVYWPWWGYPAYIPYQSMYPAAEFWFGPPVEYIERSQEESRFREYRPYCASADGYFPQVSECPAGWERVPPAPLQ
jgi:hypothetical protein